MSPISRPSQRPVAPDAPFRHLIATYTHKMRAVVCTCGFNGSSVSADGKPSEWDRHIRENRVQAV
jgi:hypothetical protein